MKILKSALLFAITAALAVVSNGANAATLESIHIQPKSSRIHVLLEVDQPLAYHLEQGQPDSCTIILPHTTASGSIPRMNSMEAGVSAEVSSTAQGLKIVLKRPNAGALYCDVTMKTPAGILSQVPLPPVSTETVAPSHSATALPAPPTGGVGTPAGTFSHNRAFRHHGVKKTYATQPRTQRQVYRTAAPVRQMLAQAPHQAPVQAKPHPLITAKPTASETAKSSVPKPTILPHPRTSQPAQMKKAATSTQKGAQHAQKNAVASAAQNMQSSLLHWLLISAAVLGGIILLIIALVLLGRNQANRRLPQSEAQTPEYYEPQVMPSVTPGSNPNYPEYLEEAPSAGQASALHRGNTSGLGDLFLPPADSIPDAVRSTLGAKGNPYLLPPFPPSDFRRGRNQPSDRPDNLGLSAS